MDIERDRLRLLAKLDAEIDDKRVIDAMARVRRELFVPYEMKHSAYEDRPLPIGEGQTISQPFIVALMTQELDLDGNEKVLEIGAGCGYQAAVLAELSKWVVTVERIESLARRARRTLALAGYKNVEVHVNSKSLGWPRKAPYDAIIVTAAAPKIPPEVMGQLKVGGRLVIPVGSRWEQSLLKVVKKGEGMYVKNLTLCRFVPLIAQEAWGDE